MAKKAGLPEGYDLRVTAEDLTEGPASLAGYLDDRPRAPLPQKTELRKEKVIRPPSLNRNTVEEPSRETRLPEVTIAQPQETFIEKEPPQEIKKVKPKRERGIRMQMNLSPEVERKVNELLDILSRQSPDGKVTISELMQALIINAYDVRDGINSKLPQRGRWGTASAKSYPAELSIVIKEAIQKEGRGDGFSNFRRAVG